MFDRYKWHRQKIEEGMPWKCGDLTAYSETLKAHLWLANTPLDFNWYESGKPSIPLLYRWPLRRHFERLRYQQHHAERREGDEG